MKLLLVCLLSHNATSRVSQKITLWHGMCCVKSFFKLSCILSPIDSVCHDPFKSKITIISNYCCNDPSVTCNISHSCAKGFTCPKQFYSFFRVFCGVLKKKTKLTKIPWFLLHTYICNLIHEERNVPPTR